MIGGRRSPRTSVVGKYSASGTSDNSLLKHQLPRIVTGRVQQGNRLMIPILASWIFPVSNFDCALLHIDV